MLCESVVACVLHGLFDTSSCIYPECPLMYPLACIPALVSPIWFSYLTGTGTRLCLCLHQRGRGLAVAERHWLWQKDEHHPVPSEGTLRDRHRQDGSFEQRRQAGLAWTARAARARTRCVLRSSRLVVMIPGSHAVLFFLHGIYILF